jgi:hypothetical protein
MRLRRLPPWQWTLCLALVLIGLLEIWRPLYFLTDDNLNQFMPVLNEVGDNLQHGRPPWTSRCLFGGNYDLGRDPTYVSLFHPLLVLYAAVTAGTKGILAVMDLVCAMHLVLAAVGFARMVERFREKGWSEAGDGAVVFLSLSYTFTMYHLWFGASWFNMLGAGTALPWTVWLLMAGGGRKVICTLAWLLVNVCFTTHPGPVFFTGLMLLFVAFSLELSGGCRGAVKTLCLGGLLGTLVVLPLYLYCYGGFITTERSLGLGRVQLSGGVAPLPLFISFWLGAFPYWVGQKTEWFSTHPAQAFAVAGAAAAPLLWGAFLRKQPWKRIEIWWLTGMFYAVVVEWRPGPMQDIMLHFPILRAIGAPYREIVQFQFMAHGLMALRFPFTKTNEFRVLSLAGTVLFLVSLLPYGAPTIAEMKVDREMVFSGRAARFWEDMKARHPGAVFLPVVSPEELEHPGLSFALLGTNCYPCLFGFTSLTGYSQVEPGSLRMDGQRALRYHWNGLVDPARADGLRLLYPNLIEVKVGDIMPVLNEGKRP